MKIFCKVLTASMVLVGLISSASFAAAEDIGVGCVDDTGTSILNQPEAIQKQISQKEFCYEAVDIARACQHGSSLDVDTAAAASQVCEKELSTHQPTVDDWALLARMKKRCDEQYGQQEGTMYLSVNAFCQLDATHWITDVTNGSW